MRPDHLNEANKAIGQRIRDLRTAAGKSQSDMAKPLGIAWQQFWKYENGTNRISAASLSAVAAELGVDIGDLFPSRSSSPASLMEAVIAERNEFARQLYQIRRVMDGQSAA